MTFTYSYPKRFLLFLFTFSLFTCSINEEERHFVAKKNVNSEAIDQWTKSISRKKLEFIAEREMNTKGIELHEKIKKIEGSFENTNATKLYVHYMPWFQSPEVDGLWGQHWTMVNKNPDIYRCKWKKGNSSSLLPTNRALFY